MLQVTGTLIPPTAVALLFWFIVRAVVHADRRERTAKTRLDAQEGAAGGGTTADTSATPRPDRLATLSSSYGRPNPRLGRRREPKISAFHVIMVAPPSDQPRESSSVLRANAENVPTSLLTPPRVSTV